MKNQIFCSDKVGTLIYYNGEYIMLDIDKSEYYYQISQKNENDSYAHFQYLYLKINVLLC